MRRRGEVEAWGRRFGRREGTGREWEWEKGGVWRCSLGDNIWGGAEKV